MAKHIRLNERDLKRIIKESVIRFLNENTDEVLDTPERALKAYKAAKADKDAHPGKSKLSPDPAIRAKRKRQMDAFGSKAADLMNQEIDDPNLLVLGDRGARRMYYVNKPYEAYITNDVEDLDGLKLYSDTYQEGDEPLTIANLPDDERERVHRGFEKFMGFHNSPDASLEESVKRAVRKVINENKLWNAMLDDMNKFANSGKDVYDFIEFASDKYGIDEDTFYTSGGYEAWCRLTGEDPLTYEI